MRERDCAGAGFLATVCAACGRLTLWRADGGMPRSPAPESGPLCTECFQKSVRLAYWRELAGLSTGIGTPPSPSAAGRAAAHTAGRPDSQAEESTDTDRPPSGPTQPPPRYDRPAGRPGVFATYGYALRVAAAWLLLALGGLAVLALTLRLLWALGGLLAGALGVGGGR